MGLDIYVGPLGRYYAGEWETVVQKAGRELGVEVTVSRPPGHRFPLIADALQAVLEWRDRISPGLADLTGERLDWEERADGEYFTDKPDFDGLSSVQLLAAREEFPSMSLPVKARSAPSGSLWELVEDRYTISPLANSILKLLRRPRPRKVGPFEQIYFPNLWLPIHLPPTVHTVDAYGRPIAIGSVHFLRAQLDDLYDRVRISVPAAVEAEIDDRALDEHQFLAVAAHGLARWRGLASIADQHRLPMVLDS
jgi:hypothetical protein